MSELKQDGRAAQLLELIERLEQANAPDRDLDRDIAPLIGLRVVNEGHPLGVCYYDKQGHGVPLPAFTSSLDAAMSLVLEQDQAEVLRQAMRNLGAEFALHIRFWSAEDHGPYARALARFVAAAALRARLSQESQS